MHAQRQFTQGQDQGQTPDNTSPVNQTTRYQSINQSINQSMLYRLVKGNIIIESTKQRNHTVSNGEPQGNKAGVTQLQSLIQPMKQHKKSNSVSYVSSKKSKTVYQSIKSNLFDKVQYSHAIRPCPITKQ